MQRNTIRSQPGQRSPSAEDRAGPLFVQSVEKALGVMSAFHTSDTPLTLAELAERAGIDRSAAQRMVHTLRKLGYIRRDPDGHGFVPGIRILDHTLDCLRLDPLVRRATPVLQELRRTVRERVDLSLFDDRRVLYAVRLQTKRQTLNTSLVGHSVPTFCTSGGWAILAKLPPDRARDIVERSDRRPFTADTICDVETIMDRVEETRQNGFALALNQILMGEIAAGFAVLDSTGAPVAAIHVAASLSEWTPEDFVQQLVPVGLASARAISQF